MSDDRVLRRVRGLEATVPDPGATAGFLEDALEMVHHSDDDGREHVTVEGEYGLGGADSLLALRRADELGLASIVIEVADEDALDRVAARVDPALDEPARRGEDADGPLLSFIDPGGVHVRCVLPSRADATELPPSDVRPRRLSHLNLKVPDPPRSARWWRDVLGMYLTEAVEDRLFFLRVASEHHNLAFRPGAPVGIMHHVAFEVPGWESFRVVCDHMAARGYQIEYGPGRHAPGHSLFLYLRDPASGLRLELCTDMARIDDPDAFETVERGFSRLRSVNVWGPAPPESFLA